MKIYVVSWRGSDFGHQEAFSSRREAQKKYNELKREERKNFDAEEEDDSEVEQLFDIAEYDFPISKEGIIRAFNEGSDSVSK